MWNEGNWIDSREPQEVELARYESGLDWSGKGVGERRYHQGWCSDFRLKNWLWIPGGTAGLKVADDGPLRTS